MAFEFDDSEWPVVSARWTETLTDDEALAVLARVDVYLARGERFGLLIDARGARGLSPEQRNLLLTHMKENVALTSRLLVQALVIDKPVQRTLYYGINLLFPRTFPSKAFAEPGAARVWLVSELAKRTAL